MRLDELPESWTRNPYQHEYPEHPVFDDPGTVRVIDIPDVVRYTDDLPTPPVEDDGARLKAKPWDQEKVDDLSKALDAALEMRAAAEAFVGWFTNARPLLADDYADLIDEADARIARVRRLAEQ
jgi:hypothetical protein